MLKDKFLIIFVNLFLFIIYINQFLLLFRLLSLESSETIFLLLKHTLCKLIQFTLFDY